MSEIMSGGVLCTALHPVAGYFLSTIIICT